MSRRATAWIFPSTTGRANTEKANLKELSQDEGSPPPTGPTRREPGSDYVDAKQRAFSHRRWQGKANLVTCNGWGQGVVPTVGRKERAGVSNSRAFTLSPKTDLIAYSSGEQRQKPALLLTKSKQDVDSSICGDVNLRTDQIPLSHDAVLHGSAYWTPCPASHQQKAQILLKN